MPKHNLLGQNFLKTRRPVELMISGADKEPPVDVVLEIGPGLGSLTKNLARKFSRVIAVEKDRRLAEGLKRILEEEKIKNCEIVAGDILKIDFLELLGPGSYAVISNIPYYLTSRLLRILLEARRQPAYIVLMVQKEVAERIIGRPPQMSVLALSIQAYGKPEIIGRVSKKEFAPQPKVDSAIIKISGVSKAFFEKYGVPEKAFFQIIRTAFSQKRKQLANSLAGFYGSKPAAEKKIKKAGLSPASRPQELSLQQWAALMADN